MPIEILMPALSPTMTEGTLARWLKKEGDAVKSGDVIAEIETDKATMEVEAVDEGKIGRILVPEGSEGVLVNARIAWLLEEGEDASAIKDAPAAASAPAAQTAAATAPAAASAPAAAPASAHGEKVVASPLAKRVASLEGIDLKGVQGTGPHGRIVKADVEDAKASGGVRKSAPVASVGRNPVEYTEIKNSGMRKTIAKRLLESKQTVPHFYLTVECRMDDLLAVRAQINKGAEAAAGEGGKPAYKVSVNDFVIRAVALALRDVPEANATWTDAAILQYTNVDVSVAVAIDGGLITPIIRNADQKSLSVLSNEMKALAKRARDGKLQPEEYQGGGFSISNLGMYGVKQFNAIINPPQSCILAIGASEEKVVRKGDGFAVANVMQTTLSSDHRVVDGAVGATFLAAFQRYMENPLTMLV